MSKHRKADLSQYASGSRLTIEEHERNDHLILPPAEELAKLVAIEPTALRWIMERAEIEQNENHKYKAEQIKAFNKDIDNTFKLSRTSLWLGFVLTLIILVVGIIFVYKDLNIQGTIFTGLGIIMIIVNILNFNKAKS